MARSLPCPKGKLVIAVELEVVRAVEPGERAVPIQHRDPIPSQAAESVSSAKAMVFENVYDTPSSVAPMRLAPENVCSPSYVVVLNGS